MWQNKKEMKYFKNFVFQKQKVINKLKERWRGPFVINKARFYHSLSL